jgi:hypothetical protein
VNPTLTLAAAARATRLAYPLLTEAVALRAQLLADYPAFKAKNPSSLHNACRCELAKEAFIESPTVAAAAPVIKLGELIQTDLGSDYGVHTISAEDFGLLLKDYSREWEGKALNQDQLAVKYGFPNPHAVARFVKIHGIRQTSAPFTETEMEAMSPEEAAEEAAGTWKRKYFQVAQKKKFDAVAADAAKWNNFDDNTLKPLIEAIKSSLPRLNVVPLQLPTAIDPYCVVTGPADLHYMKQAFNAKGDKVYGRKIAVAKLKAATEDLAAQIMLRGAPDKLYYIAGNDGLHIDGKTQKTTAGTEQANQTEGNYAIDFDLYLDLRISNILRMAQIAPVTVVILQGNHDWQSALAERRILEATFANHPRVSVVRCYDSRVYLQYGLQGFGFAHGDGLKNLRGQLHKLIMVEARGQGVNIGQIMQWHFFTGHLHTDKVEDLGGVILNQMPALCAPDDWHKNSGYVGNVEDMSAYLISPTRGRRGVIYAEGLESIL